MKYAPELNPADKVWSHVKYARLGNYAPADLVQLRDTVKTELEAIKKRPTLLHLFVRRAGLDIKALK
jgi:transposase